MLRIKQFDLLVLLIAVLVLGACAGYLSAGVPIAGSPTVVSTPLHSQATTPASKPTVVLTPKPSQAPASEPTALSEPTVVPTTVATYPSEPTAVVEAFLTQFQAGINYTQDPETYLSNGLRAQIRPDHPLNLMFGLQNGFNEFSIVGSEGTAGTVYVRATLGAGSSERTFALIQEDDQWRIDQITLAPSDEPAPPTPEPANELPTPRPADGLGFSGPIAFLDIDGVTFDSVKPDGSDPVHALGHPSEPVDELGFAPGPNTVLVAQRHHYLTASGGLAIDLGEFAQTPHWSPDGSRIVGQSIASDGTPGPAYLYDLRQRTGSTLPIFGVPDWYPDGQRLVYAASSNAPNVEPGNVYSYDLASGTHTRLTTLVSTEDDRWIVQQAHVLPDGEHIIFYGNHTSQLGASGNGQRWWVIPVAGGDPAPFSDAGGNGIAAYAPSPDGTWLAYADQMHDSACASQGNLIIHTSDVLGGVALSPPLPGSDTQNGHYVSIHGVSWSPDGKQIIFGVQPYTCANGGAERELGTPEIYIWDFSAGNGASIPAPRKIAHGSYPVWIQ